MYASMTQSVGYRILVPAWEGGKRCEFVCINLGRVVFIFFFINTVFKSLPQTQAYSGLHIYLYVKAILTYSIVGLWLKSKAQMRYWTWWDHICLTWNWIRALVLCLHTSLFNLSSVEGLLFAAIHSFTTAAKAAFSPCFHTFLSCSQDLAHANPNNVVRAGSCGNQLLQI